MPHDWQTGLPQDLLHCQPAGPQVSLQPAGRLATEQERSGLQDSSQELLQGLQNNQDVKDIKIIQNIKVFKDILKEPDWKCVFKTVSGEKGGGHKQGGSEEGSASSSVSSTPGLSLQNTLSWHNINLANILNIPKETANVGVIFSTFLQACAYESNSTNSNELFKIENAGEDLKAATLKLMNEIRSEQEFLDILKICNITSLYKSKGSRKEYKRYFQSNRTQEYIEQAKLQ